MSYLGRSVRRPAGPSVRLHPVSLAVDETVILPHPPSTFSRCINSVMERERQQNDTLVNG